MKKIFIILGIMVVLVLLAFVFIFLNKKSEKKDSINSIEYFHFSYSTSTMANYDVIYEISEDNGKYLLSVKPNAYPVEETKEKIVSKNVIDEILKVLNENNVISWDGFEKYDQDVLDGNSFLFNLKTQEKKEIKASGYMMWPKNYDKVKDELDRIFNAYIDMEIS